VALGLLNACRYGYLDWGVSLIKEVQGESVGSAAIKFAILPAGGIVGAFGSGWITDRLFGGRRAPMICGMLVGLAGMTLVFRSAVEMGSAATVVTLFCIGILIYGPQVLLVGTAPTDMARGGAVASAVGFVNFMGYMGASAGDWFTARIADSSRGWDGVYWLWTSWALAAAGCAGVLWNRSAARETARGTGTDRETDRGADR
jgi:sugar phosphate permease